MSAGSDGSLHLVWNDDFNDVYYSSKPSGSSWTAPLTLANSASGEYQPRVTAGSDGRVHVVYWHTNPDWGVYYLSKPTGGAWDAATLISPIGGVRRPAVAADNSGTVHVVWDNQNPSLRSIFYTKKPSGGSWTSPVTVSICPQDCQSANLVVDGNGTLHLIAKSGNTGGVYYASKPASGNWSTYTQLLPDNKQNNHTVYQFYSDIAVSGSVAHVVWHAGTTVYYANTQTGLGSGTALTTSGILPDIHITNGRIVVAWQDTTTNKIVSRMFE